MHIRKFLFTTKINQLFLVLTVVEAGQYEESYHSLPVYPRLSSPNCSLLVLVIVLSTDSYLPLPVYPRLPSFSSLVILVIVLLTVHFASDLLVCVHLFLHLLVFIVVRCCCFCGGGWCLVVVDGRIHDVMTGVSHNGSRLPI